MSELTPAQQHVLDEAEKVNQERMAAVQDLAVAVARRVELEHELSEAKKEEKRLMVAAERQGWTRAQVARFSKPPKSNTRKNSASSRSDAHQDEIGGSRSDVTED
ncbi:hypothetical protein [Nesterenkonia sandarakina]|uniref:Uncharacterized protein n=1 Tax=Nesterenkonia sandarakina TaxID=272918 RepID=A0A7Z0EAP2_9MICC|nr:hypothetical protein [Nesterenkonia sandarakina]NYJ18120.1 hypothetical protein [Nesterenkonia sandarakina]